MRTCAFTTDRFPGQELRAKIRWGNVEFDGDISKDTPGSDLIRDLLINDDPEPINPSSPKASSPNFTPAAQNDFAARMLWSVTPTYSGANHEPNVAIRNPARIVVRPGGMVRLVGVASDPDGNAVSVRWWRWKDVDTFPGHASLSNPTDLMTQLQVPAEAMPGQTIQLVLEATDEGKPALTRYQRVVVSVTR